MNLIIDQGNTQTKYAVMDTGQEPVFKAITQHLEASVLNNIGKGYTIQNIFISSVKADYAALGTIVKASLPHTTVIFFDDDCRLPLTNLYATPKTLGKDRLAGVCGAMEMFPHENCLVMDAGTCITYDFIDKSNHYHGGSISPGLQMRLQAMHQYTGKLPQAPLEWVEDFTGNSTITCLQTGVVYGMMNEIEGFVNRYKKRWGTVKTLLCGGDTDFLAKRLEIEIFAAPDLVITGLNKILKYNLTDVA